MSILKELYVSENWQQYLNELESKEDFKDKHLIQNVRKVISDGIDKISLKSFPLATRKEIAKYKTSKKRVVYLYPEPHNTYLKMINWLLQNNPNYASKLCVNSYAYQKNKSVSTGVKRLQKELNLNRRKKFIKADFTDYFNSINIDILTNKLAQFFEEDDMDLMSFLYSLISNPKVIVNGKVTELHNKGVMAGTPISGYLANIYMNDVDWEMYRRHIYYIRYADDVFILTNDVDRDLKIFQDLISELKVSLNPKKTEVGDVKDGFTVLGFAFKDGEIDVDEAKVQKMFNRIKRRSKWFRTWADQKKVKNEVMVRTFIKGMNAKLYSGDDEDRMNWSRWYFANITTTKNIERVDAYLVQYIRYLISGKHLGYKKHSEVSYDTIKKYGFKSLVNSYWKYKKKGVKSDELCSASNI